MNMKKNAASNRPRVASAIGCPAGTAPELTARMGARRRASKAHAA